MEFLRRKQGGRMYSRNENKKIVIVCEDTYGLDVYAMIDAINQSVNSERKYSVVGFVSDIQNIFNDIEMPAPFLGTIKSWQVQKNISCIVAIRNPSNKKMAVECIKEKGGVFETIIAPWTILPQRFEHGEGCIIASYSFKNYAKFGDFVILDSSICESVEIGDYSTLCAFSNTTSAKIGRRVYVGSHSAVISKREIGDDVFIFPGSIVMTNLKSGSKVAGVPAMCSRVKKWEG